MATVKGHDLYDKNDIVCIISPPVAAGHRGQFICNDLLN